MRPSARRRRDGRSRAFVHLGGRRLLVAPAGAVIGRSRGCDIVRRGLRRLAQARRDPPCGGRLDDPRSRLHQRRLPRTDPRSTGRRSCAPGTTSSSARPRSSSRRREPRGGRGELARADLGGAQVRLPGGASTCSCCGSRARRVRDLRGRPARRKSYPPRVRIARRRRTRRASTRLRRSTATTSRAGPRGSSSSRRPATTQG